MSAVLTSVRRSAIGLGLFAVITGGTIALTQMVTRDRIAYEVAKAEAAALFEIIPQKDHDNQLINDTLALPDDSRFSDSPVLAWVARRGGEPFGLIIPAVAPDGYSGDIRLLVGVDRSGTVLGVRVTSHRETPGLGDAIELRKSDWITSFDGRSLSNPEAPGWTVRKNGGIFDQFTGATITPRAVVKAVERTLRFVDRHHLEIWQAAGAAPLNQARDVQFPEGTDG